MGSGYHSGILLGGLRKILIQNSRSVVKDLHSGPSESVVHAMIIWPKSPFHGFSGKKEQNASDRGEAHIALRWEMPFGILDVDEMVILKPSLKYTV